MNRVIILFFTFFITQARGENISSRFEVFKDKNCIVTKNYQMLSKDEVSQLESKLNSKISFRTIRKLDVNCGNQKSNAFILSDKIRTHFQALLIWINKDKVKNISLLEFDEPERYKPPFKWLQNILGMGKKELHKVDALSGATLTRHSTLKLINQALYFSGNEKI